jgi:hypothetical protein
MAMFRDSGINFLERWPRLRNSLFDTYRPELHYMRGPGPKWREKHGEIERTAIGRG